MNNRKNAFTLAEVLITLGIIGVVSALTIPTLVENHRKQVVGTRLKKFYSTFNQAIQMSSAENGDFKTWWLDGASNSEHTEWEQEYIVKYMKIVKKERACFGENTMTYYLPDGGAFARLNSGTTRDWIYFTLNPRKCFIRYSRTSMAFTTVPQVYGSCAFPFQLIPNKDWNHGFGFAPWSYEWTDNNIETLKNGCKKTGVWCTKVIQLNDWKIPDDYPKRVFY